MKRYSQKIDEMTFWTVESSRTEGEPVSKSLSLIRISNSGILSAFESIEWC